MINPRFVAATEDRLSVFAANVRAVAQQRGMSISDLAEAAKIARPSLSHILSGKREPMLLTAQDIADALKIDLHYLMTPHPLNESLAVRE